MNNFPRPKFQFVQVIRGGHTGLGAAIWCEPRAAFEMAVGHAGPIVRVGWNDSAAFTFMPVDRDTFQLAGMFLRFRRDDAGRVVRLDSSNPVVRNIQFTRLNDDTGSR